jgi:hypothetical protein
VSAVAAEPAQATPGVQANSPKPGDFGADAGNSADVALDGWGDAAGYHVELGRESSGFAWSEVALLRPAGRDESSWAGYQCLSGDGRFAAVAILPRRPSISRLLVIMVRSRIRWSCPPARSVRWPPVSG